MIREATWLDVNHVEALIRMHYDSTGFPNELEYDRDLVIQSIGGLLTQHGCALFVADYDSIPVGVLGLQVATTFFAKDTASRELFLYVRPEFRGMHLGVSLVKAGEEWAKAQGATISIIGDHPLSPPHVHATYLRHGYREAQRDYIKRLCPGVPQYPEIHSLQM